ncbi:M23 family metallopeptidase [Streptomyces bacillaris]|uniref:M23 family metallopeptidase n=1 Tax=unclassified Streptomyces TaxID=2593676 RepID=UPI0003805665|nr:MULTISPECIES: M23 family metallopeptidase [unclassified Streptomyces]MYT38158.1 peptidoglycan DD-metalloendopeptidase family protein [Streptomyces sp. SID8356]
MFSGLSIRITVAALAVTGLLAVAPVATAAPDASTAATSADIVVRMPSAVQDRLGADRGRLIDAVSADVVERSRDAEGLAPKAAVAKLADEGRKVVVDVRTVAGDWARGVAYVEASRARHGEPEGWLYIAHRQDGRWIPGLEGDREFAAYVARSPLVGEAERRNMTAYAERRTEPQAGAPEVGITANTNGLLLPWMPDYYMTLTGGPHAHDGGSGYWSALDFAGGNASGLVRSSREGTATSMCGAGGGWTRVIHPGGFSTDYYHMRNTTYYNGTSIARSALLGTIGTDTCAGGSATGAHVHWSLRTYDANYNGQYTWLNGRTIGGWAWWNGSGQYSGCGTRLGVTACPGTAIYNRTS